MVDDRPDDDLDQLFAQARQDAPSADLQARVVAEGLAIQMATLARDPEPSPRVGLLTALARAVGGWPALSGVTAAGVIGLGLGFYAPDLVDTLSGGAVWSLNGNAAVTPDISGLWTEIGDV